MRCVISATGIGWSFSIHRTDEAPTRLLLNLHALISGEARR